MFCMLLSYMRYIPCEVETNDSTRQIGYDFKDLKQVQEKKN